MVEGSKKETRIFSPLAIYNWACPFSVAYFVLWGSLASGVLAVVALPGVVRGARAWFAKYREARKVRPAMRKILWQRALAVAEDVERYAKENCDVEMELLSMAIAHSTYNVSHEGGKRWWRLESLRDIVDVAAPRVVDRWWRGGKTRGPSSCMWDIIRRLEGESDSSDA